MYFTIVSLCKLPRNVHDILFEAFHEISKFWKSIFRIFSIVKDFPIEFVFMLDSFIINNVCKILKENVNKSKKQTYNLFYIKKNWKIGWSSSFPWWVKKVNFDAITRFQVYQAHRRNRSSHRRSSVKKLYLKFSQNSQESTCARASGLQLY